MKEGRWSTSTSSKMPASFHCTGYCSQRIIQQAGRLNSFAIGPVSAELVRRNMPTDGAATAVACQWPGDYLEFQPTLTAFCRASEDSLTDFAGHGGEASLPDRHCSGRTAQS